MSKNVNEPKTKAKTKVSDLKKFSINQAKESFKSAYASYVQFLITSGVCLDRTRLSSFILDVECEILDLIDFD